MCISCQQAIKSVPERCYRCRKATMASRTCSSCRKHSPLRYVLAATNYEGIAKELVQALKFNGTRAASSSMVELLVPLLSITPITRKTYVAHVPTATRRVRQRGYDPGLVAQAVAAHTGLPCVELLARVGQTHSSSRH